MRGDLIFGHSPNTTCGAQVRFLLAYQLPPTHKWVNVVPNKASLREGGGRGGNADKVGGSLTSRSCYTFSPSLFAYGENPAPSRRGPCRCGGLFIAKVLPNHALSRGFLYNEKDRHIRRSFLV